MDRNMLQRYVELMNEYSINKTLTPEDINFVNQVNQIAQQDISLLNIINKIRQTSDTNERLNIVNLYYSQSNEVEQNSTTEESLMLENEVQIQEEAPVQQAVEPTNEIQHSKEITTQQKTEQETPVNNYNTFIDNISADNYEANIYDKPKQLKKSGFVNPFIFSLIFGFVGGAIVTTLMIILK